MSDRVSSLVEVKSCCFENGFVLDVGGVLAEPGVERFFSLTDMLLTTVATVDQIHHIRVLAGDLGVDINDFRGCLGSDSFSSLNKLASSAVPTFVHSFLCSLGSHCSYLWHLWSDQSILDVLWTFVSHQWWFGKYFKHSPWISSASQWSSRVGGCRWWQKQLCHQTSPSQLSWELHCSLRGTSRAFLMAAFITFLL